MESVSIKKDNRARFHFDRDRIFIFIRKTHAFVRAVEPFVGVRMHRPENPRLVRSGQNPQATIVHCGVVQRHPRTRQRAVPRGNEILVLVPRLTGFTSALDEEHGLHALHVRSNDPGQHLLHRLLRQIIVHHRADFVRMVNTKHLSLHRIVIHLLTNRRRSFHAAAVTTANTNGFPLEFRQVFLAQGVFYYDKPVFFVKRKGFLVDLIRLKSPETRGKGGSTHNLHDTRQHQGLPCLRIALFYPQRTLYLTEMPFSWGEIVYEAQSAFGPRHQQCFQMVMVCQGRMRIHLGGETLLLHEGQGIWLVPGVDEFFEMGLQGRLHHAWIHAEPQLFPANPGMRVPASQRIFAGEPTFQKLLQCLMEAPVAEVDDPQNYHGMLASACCWWVIEKLGLTDQATPQRHPAVSRALACIRSCFASHMDMATLAREAGISPQQLTRLFRDDFACTPIRYLWQFRDREALRLIRNTGLRFSEIADRCGYSNPYHFTRRITRQFGKSPRALRQECWKKTVQPPPGQPSS